jgi:hypothetical protein
MHSHFARADLDFLGTVAHRNGLNGTPIHRLVAFGTKRTVMLLNVVRHAHSAATVVGSIPVGRELGPARVTREKTTSRLPSR